MFLNSFINTYKTRLFFKYKTQKNNFKFSIEIVLIFHMHKLLKMWRNCNKNCQTK